MISLHQVKGIYTGIVRETEDSRFSVERQGSAVFGYYYKVTDKTTDSERNVKLLSDARVLIEGVYDGQKLEDV